MTAHSQALTAVAIAQSDRAKAQRRYDDAKAKGDTQAMHRAMRRLEEATQRALMAEVRAQRVIR